MDGELGDEGLPRPRRRRDDDRASFEDRLDRVDLKVVELEWVAILKAPEGLKLQGLETAGPIRLLQ
jgi:hypothetical protein